jgi:hypothetical protein
MELIKLSAYFTCIYCKNSYRYYELGKARSATIDAACLSCKGINLFWLNDETYISVNIDEYISSLDGLF